MKKKSFLLVIIVLCGMLFACGILTACDGNGGKYSQGLRYRLNDDGTGYLVSGLGDCKDNDVRIPDEYNEKPVLEIGMSAFIGCDEITSITIPDSVTEIGDSAFWGCNGLTSITVEKGNTKYHSSGNCLIETATKTLIAGCKNSVIPTDGSVTTIGDNAFADCIGLASITIPSSVTTIGDSAFWHCSGLANITIPDSVTEIGNSAFWWCDGLTSLTIPDSVKEIGRQAFDRCTGLTGVIVPDGVKTIGSRAFGFYSEHTIYCAATSKPSGWADDWNGSCPTVWDYLNNEIADDGNIYVVNNGVRYALKDGIATVCRQSTAISGDVEILSEVTHNGKKYSVTTIAKEAFEECGRLTSVIVPDGITAIGEMAFYRCYALKNVAIAEGLISIGNNSFDACYNLASIAIPDSVAEIGDYGFRGCAGLTSITIPSSVTTIGEGVFIGCDGLTSITIPSSVTIIGNSAFSNCSGLTSIVIPDSVAEIRNYAFYDCSGLTIYCEATSKSSGWSDFWNVGDCPVVWGYPNNEVADDGNIYVVNNGIRYALKDGIATVCRQSKAISGNVEILSEVTHNGKKYSVTAIGDDAFRSCSGLTSITIPDSVTIIGKSAFEDCSGLTSITIPDSVTTIVGGVFQNCNNLTKVYYKGTAEQWSNIIIDNSNNNYFINATRYYYSETKPTTPGNYWHYADGKVVEW